MGEQSFSQDPPIYIWDEVLKFKKQPMPEHIQRYIPQELNTSEWLYLSLQCNSLEDWEKHVNDSLNEDKTPILKKMLHDLLPLSNNWVVIFELNCDQIDNVYQMDNLDLLSKIETVLNWNNEPEGFIAWQKS